MRLRVGWGGALLTLTLESLQVGAAAGAGAALLVDVRVMARRARWEVLKCIVSCM